MMTEHHFSMLMMLGIGGAGIAALSIYILTGAWTELPLVAFAAWFVYDEWKFDRDFNHR